MAEYVFKRGLIWTAISSLTGILFMTVGIQLITLLTPPLVENIGSYSQYGLPLGILVQFLIVLTFFVGVFFILASVRGYISYKLSEQEYKQHLINRVFSGYNFVMGAVFFGFLIAFFAMIDYKTLTDYLAIFSLSEASQYIIIFVAVVGLLLFLGIIHIIGGKRGLKKINAFDKRNNPHIAAKVFMVFFLIVTIGLTGILTSMANGALFTGTPSIPEKYEYNIGPWVEFGPTDAHKISDTATSMEIWWFTAEDIGTDAILKFGLTPNIDDMQSVTERSGGDGKHHVVDLTGLEPDTQYYYTIPSLGDKIYNFTTGPEVDSGKPFRFVCVGDTRNSGDGSPSLYGDLNKAIDIFYSRQGDDFAFKINVGDVDSNGADLESWRLYLNQSAQHAASHPYMISIGNHELGGDNGANFDYLYPYGRYYSFNYSSAHFLFINTFAGIVGNVDPEQMKFIEEDLKANAGKHFIIVSFHVPPFSTGDFNMNDILISQLYNLFKQYKVDLVLTGHDHHYDSFLFDKDEPYNGTYYFVNGGGGAPLDYYIMTRPDKTWQTWYHNRSSPYGLYQHDKYTEMGHIYGELSYGFMDIQVSEKMLNITYYRWLDLQHYMEITNQTLETYHNVQFNQTQWDEFGLDRVTPVMSYIKYRDFSIV